MNKLKHFFNIAFIIFFLDALISCSSLELANMRMELANKDKENEKGKETIKELAAIISKIQEENKGLFLQTILQLFLSYFFLFTNLNRSCFCNGKEK